LWRVFTHLHLRIHQVGDQRLGQIREALNPLHQRILHLLQVPATLYQFEAQLSSETSVVGG
jgi:hypothetical protein